MKTFKEFQEQLEQQMAKKTLEAKKSMNVTKTSAMANMRHRKHVHDELARHENPASMG